MNASYRRLIALYRQQLVAWRVEYSQDHLDALEFALEQFGPIHDSRLAELVSQRELQDIAVDEFGATNAGSRAFTILERCKREGIMVSSYDVPGIVQDNAKAKVQDVVVLCDYRKDVVEFGEEARRMYVSYQGRGLI